MRPWTILPLLLLAGCVDAPAETGPETVQTAAAEDEASEATSFVGGTLEGTVWLPSSDGQARKETLLALPANHTGMLVVAEVTLGSAYGGVELPVTAADVLVELRGPTGDVLADAHLAGAERTATLEGTTVQDGGHTLALLSYGGSDGSANGDHVHYHVDAKVP